MIAWILRRKTRAQDVEGDDLQQLELAGVAGAPAALERDSSAAKDESPKPRSSLYSTIARSSLRTSVRTGGRAGDKVVSFKLPRRDETEFSDHRGQPRQVSAELGGERQPSDRSGRTPSERSDRPPSERSDKRFVPVRFSGDGWQRTHESVHDAHRAQQKGKDAIPRIQTAPTELKPAELADASVGHARDLAKPGGFRRAHVLSNLPEGDRATAAALKPFAVVDLKLHGFDEFFVTSVVQTFDDGTRIHYDSRSYRRGRVPLIERSDSTLVKYEPAAGDTARRVCGFIRPYSLSYWVSFSFFTGSILFVLGGISDLIPGVDPNQTLDFSLVGYPYAIGSVLFTLGAYLAVVEIVNGNLQLDAAKLTSTRSPTADGRVRPNRAYIDELEAGQWSVGSCGMCASSLTWIAWQPQSRVYLGNLTQLFGAILFNVSTFTGLPAVLAGVSADALPAVNNALVYSTSLVGGVCFAVAGYVGLIEVTHSPNPFRLPQTFKLGYLVSVLNFSGGAGFLVAPCFYYTADASDIRPDVDLELTRWGLKFMYLFASVLFAVAAACGIAEVLQDG